MRAHAPSLPARLASVQRRFEKWRSSRPTWSSRIPAGLWAAAIRCAEQYGTYRTVRALGLDYNCLKRRVEAAGAVAPAVATKGAGFVEVLPSGRWSSPECILELENSRGAKLRLELRGSAVPDVVELARRFGAAEG